MFRIVPFIVTTDSSGDFESAAAAQNKIRDPMLLYPELEERAWECVRKTTHGDEIRLLLRPIAD